jgi:hypothetical protein
LRDHAQLNDKTLKLLFNDSSYKARYEQLLKRTPGHLLCRDTPRLVDPIEDMSHRLAQRQLLAGVDLKNK